MTFKRRRCETRLLAGFSHDEGRHLVTVRALRTGVNYA